MWGATYGLPDVYHPDEPRIVERAVRFHGGDLNPRFFNWPSLSMYLLSGVYGLVFGSFGGAGVLEAFRRDPVPFYLLGRLLTAAFGTATIAVLYAVAARSFGRTVGLVASLVLSVNLLHVRDSHYVTTDVPLACLVTVATLYVLRYWRTGRLRDAVGSGLAAGLAASMKYPGGLVLAPFLLAHFRRPRRPGLPWWRHLVAWPVILAGVTAVAGFAAGTPYALLTPRAFWSGVRSELGEVSSVQLGNDGDLPGYLFHLLHSLPEAMGIPLLAAALLGLGLALRRRAPGDLILLAFPLPYFLIIGSWSSRFERYVIPLLPFMALSAAVCLVALARVVRERLPGLARRCRPGLGLAVVAGLLVAPEVARVGYLHVLLARPDTRVLAAEWIEREVPAGSRLALEPYSPSLPIAPPERGYQISRLSPYDLDALVERRVEYVVLSGFVYRRHLRACERFPQECRFYGDVERRGTLLFSIDPGPRDAPLWVGDLYSPLTRLYDRTHPGPTVRVYRLPARHA